MANNHSRTTRNHFIIHGRGLIPAPPIAIWAQSAPCHTSNPPTNPQFEAGVVHLVPVGPCMFGKEFARWLVDSFPEKDDEIYHKSKDIESVAADDAGNSSFVLHVAALGFAAGCSVKPGCGRDLFRGLRDHILQDGFVTSTEVLFISRRQLDDNQKISIFPGEDAIPAFSICYTKGQLRAGFGPFRRRLVAMCGVRCISVPFRRFRALRWP